jgi:4-amino-4-deoxychorismate mutase
MTDQQASNLAHFRAEIDRINDDLLALLKRRADMCARIAEYKRDNGIPMMQQHRLDMLQEKVRHFAEENGIDRGYLASVFGLITDEACRLEDEIIGRAATR